MSAAVEVTASGVVRLWGMHGRLEGHDGANSTDPDYGSFDFDATAVLNMMPELGRVLPPSPPPGSCVAPTDNA